MRKCTTEQLANIKTAMERINAIDSSKVFDEAKSGARVAKDHMIKTLKYLIDTKDVNEINHVLLNLYDLTESDISNPTTMISVIKELDRYQLELMEEHLDLSNSNVVDFFDYIKELTTEFEAELEKTIA